MILLDEQDRTLWNRELIAEGATLVERAIASRRFGPYTLQAAIAAIHAESRTAAATDWPQIVRLYDVLFRADPSPAVELNREAAIAMRDGPAAGLALVDGILARGDLADYALAKKDPSHLLVTFFKTPLDKASVKAAQAAITGPERLHADGRHLYMVFPDGIGNSKAGPVVDRNLKARGTARNWNTIQKLAALCGPGAR